MTDLTDYYPAGLQLVFGDSNRHRQLSWLSGAL